MHGKNAWKAYHVTNEVVKVTQLGAFLSIIDYMTAALGWVSQSLLNTT